MKMETISFELDPGRDHVELHHLLKLVGLSDSGGGAKQLVATGQVSVDGVVELRKTCKIRSGQVVQLGTSRIEVGTSPG
jgi:ribosome-associated protein